MGRRHVLPVFGVVVAAAAGAADGASRDSGRETCSSRSEARFPGAYTEPDNLVVGPLAFVGAAHTPARDVRRFGGQKFPALLKAGHHATVRVVGTPDAALAYGRLPQGEVSVRDAHRKVRFSACPRGRGRSNPTFWSGGVAAREPVCVRLAIRIDGERPARRVPLALGRSCDRGGV